jgi:hypothetical protein
VEKKAGEPTHRGGGDTKHLPITRRKYSIKGAEWLRPTAEAIANAKRDGKMTSEVEPKGKKWHRPLVYKRTGPYA